MKVILQLLILVSFGPAFGAGLDTPTTTVQTQNAPSMPPTLAIPDGATITTLDTPGASVTAIVARGDAVPTLTGYLPVIQEHAKRNNISFSLNALIDDRTDAEVQKDIQTMVEKQAQRRREFPINLVYMTVRTAIITYSYFAFFPDSSFGWELAASFVALTSNVTFFKPDTWNNLQMWSMEKFYKYATWYDFIDREKHPYLNLTLRLTVNVIYGSLINAIVGPMLVAPAKSWWVIFGGLLPSAVLNEVVDHWTYGVSKDRALMSRDQQRFINFSRQFLISSFLIPIIQAGYYQVAIATGVVGVVGLVAYWKAPEMIRWTEPIWSPVLAGVKLTRTYQYLEPRARSTVTKVLDYFEHKSIARAERRYQRAFPVTSCYMPLREAL